ncbi:MAG TPA: hypothetical protein VNX68_06515 [Nitrosopumilaceae archaeon]|jgi:hypothetical protein|nr:hypothetical protein [Nitrosopumilaceae archaeon]
MEQNEYNPYCFGVLDLIVWNGIICRYGSVRHLTTEGDELQKASEADTETYNNINK